MTLQFLIRRKSSKLFLPTILLLTLFFVTGLRFPAVAFAPKSYNELTFPPLPEIQLPAYSRYQLKNGMVVYLMEDHELPVVGGTAIFRTGARFEPANQVGLASFTGELMRTGGTQEHSPEQLNQILEQKAASIESGIGDTYGSAGFSVLSEDLDEVFNLFAEVIQEPVFSQEQLDLIINQQKGSIARRNDEPDSIAGREFYKLIYGKESPYGRTVEYADLNNIKRDDIVKFYRQSIHPQTTILGIAGDFDPQKMKALIEEKFANWQPQEQAIIPPLPSVPQSTSGGVFFVNQPQLTQSYVEMGHIGGLLNNPDYPALSVLNGVLNGFGGRLFNNVRSRQGLAYTVYGFWSANYDYPGVFNAGGQTRSETTVPFIKAIQEEIKRIQTQPITPQELTYAKESTLNSFVFNFAEPEQTLSRLMQYEYYGYPKDFIFQYQKQVENTTIQDVQNVAQKYLKPENLVILVVGNDTAIQPPLTQLDNNATVTSIDITIPE